MPAPFSHTLRGFQPPARFPPAPGAWTTVSIEEAATRAAAEARLGTPILVNFALNPVDADPKVPAIRSFTVANAQLAHGWYLVVFKDAAGAEAVADPVHAGVPGALPPDASDIRARSRLLRVKFPVDSTDPDSENDLRVTVAEATALVQGITWRLVDPDIGCPAPDGFLCELVPTSLVPVALRAVTLMAERFAVTGAAQFAEKVATGRRVRSISAGPWSESYFAPGEFARRGAVGRPPVDPDDALDAALWALMTEDARDEFIRFATGRTAPAGVVTAFDYRLAGRGGYARGFGPGPDGF